MEEDAAELGASERHSFQRLARHLSDSFNSTIISRLESSFGAWLGCPARTEAARQAGPCPRAKPPGEGEACPALGNGAWLQGVHSGSPVRGSPVRGSPVGLCPSLCTDAGC